MAYKLGDYLVVCDKCGMERYSSECRLDWQNLFVCRGCYNPRHPQDFVRGVPDDQSVGIARPEPETTIGSTTLSSSASMHAMSVVLTSVSGIAAYDSLGITLDSGIIQWTYATSAPSGTTVSIGSSLWGAATSGNTVYLPSVTNETFITASGITATGL